MATFSQDPVFGANAKKGSNAYASGANQNCGNVLTDRATSRVRSARRDGDANWQSRTTHALQCRDTTP